jgi:hypothetical protein
LILAGACGGARVERASPGAELQPPAIPDASAPSNDLPDAAIELPDAAASAPPDASTQDATPSISPLATLFDGAPDAAAPPLDQRRCAPACLSFPKGWLATDDGGLVYTWFFRGQGQFTTAEVVRSPQPKLDDRTFKMVLALAGGDRATWSDPIDGHVGKDHLPARIAEATGQARGRPARFWYAHVDLGRRKDLVLAWVTDGEPAQRLEEVIAVVRSVSATDGAPPPR